MCRFGLLSEVKACRTRLLHRKQADPVCPCAHKAVNVAGGQTSDASKALRTSRTSYTQKRLQDAAISAEIFQFSLSRALIAFHSFEGRNEGKKGTLGRYYELLLLSSHPCPIAHSGHTHKMSGISPGSASAHCRVCIVGPRCTRTHPRPHACKDASPVQPKSGALCTPAHSLFPTVLPASYAQPNNGGAPPLHPLPNQLLPAATVHGLLRHPREAATMMAASPMA